MSSPDKNDNRWHFCVVHSENNNNNDMQFLDIYQNLKQHKCNKYREKLKGLKDFQLNTFLQHLHWSCISRVPDGQQTWNIWQMCFWKGKTRSLMNSLRRAGMSNGVLLPGHCRNTTKWISDLFSTFTASWI